LSRSGKIAAVEMLALFEHDDLQPRLRQLPGGDRSARTAPDHDHVRRLVKAAIGLLYLELDDARVLLHLLERLAVVADQRLDPRVRAKEHQDEGLQRDQRFAPLANP